MRVLLVVLLLVPGVAAHYGDEPDLPPLVVSEGMAGPDAGHAVRLLHPEDGLRRGDLLLLNVATWSGPATMSLWRGQQQVAAWEVPGDGATRAFGLLLREAGAYTVDLNATSETPVALFWDAPCDCASKVLPTALPGGTLLFEHPSRGGGAWSAQVPEPEVHRLEVRAVAPTDLGARYPEGFRTLAEGSGADHRLRWTPTGPATYLLVTSTAMDEAAADRLGREGSRISPEVRFEEDRGAPAPVWGLLLAAMLLHAGLRGRNGRRLADRERARHQEQVRRATAPAGKKRALSQGPARP